MRLTAPNSTVRVGEVEIRGVQRVLELESLETAPSSDARGRASSCRHHHHHPHQHAATHAPARAPPPPATQAVPPTALAAVQARTAIVVPCKDECLERIAGVWAAIPASSLIVLVSGSSAGGYARERDALRDFCRLTGRAGVAARQRDPEVARALRAAGMGELLDGGGLAHCGKGEGLVIGIALAATARGPRRAAGGRRDGDGDGDGDGGAPGYYKYVGFIDADNFVPGSVQEYCRAFSAGLCLTQAEDAMVRISWGSKPKVRDGKLEFKQSGRSSEIVNRWLNTLLGKMDGVSVVDAGGDGDGNKDDGGLICTGNAGEHAMTISLALKLRLASGYAIEPFHFLDIWERFAGTSSVADGTGAGAAAVGRKHFTAAQLPSSPLSTSPHTSPAGTPVDCSPPLSASDHSTSPTSPSVSPAAPAACDGGGAAVPTCQQLPPPLTTTTGAGPAPPRVQIVQIRTRNPHFHEDKGEAHVVRMWRQGLAAVYHSPVTAGAPGLAQYREDLRSAILGGGCVGAAGAGAAGADAAGLPTPPSSDGASGATTPPPGAGGAKGGAAVRSEAAVLAAAGWQPERCRVYPPAGSMRLGQFAERLEGGGGSFWSSGTAEAEGEDEEGGWSGGAGGSEPDGPCSGLGFGFGSVKRPKGSVDGLCGRGW